ncbi:hypothetical protein [Campylobacter sp.]|uniref:hypothetical protein n=1 Tax=Campylobacter sp. TaxID=205 RepID=UPI0026DBD3B1|nr:hypothetical protein [Campylobacter sp.]MDO4673877.1 hypothetical protein [Campylobacter sp.]
MAYKSLDFSGFIEAFNVLGFVLQGKPSNIKNYRNEFDPFKNLISSFLIENYEEKLQINEFLDSKYRNRPYQKSGDRQGSGAI